MIPHMLLVLRDLIGANVAGFHWTDPDGRPINVHATEIMPSTIDLFVNHYDLLQRPGEISVEVLARGPLAIGNLDRWYASGRLERTVLFNEISFLNARPGCSMWRCAPGRRRAEC